MYELDILSVVPLSPNTHPTLHPIRYKMLTQLFLKLYKGILIVLMDPRLVRHCPTQERQIVHSTEALTCQQQIILQENII